MIKYYSDYDKLVGKIIQNDKKIIVYGAGMIGTIVLPYFFKQYDLWDSIAYYVDMNEHKQQAGVNVYNHKYRVLHPDYLENICSEYVILLTNSKYSTILRYLDNFDNLREVDIFIIPLILVEIAKSSPSIQLKRYSEVPQIPKKIHYCWFGGAAIPESLQKCIDSWKRYCPDYEIIQWNEDNYDYTKIPYVREAYKAKKFSFVSDVARLEILYEHGGIYFDTDVELYGSLDDLLYQEGFIGVEKWGNINSGGGCGVIPTHPMIKEMIDERSNIPFILEDGSLNIETNGNYETIPFIRHGMKIDNTLQHINGMTVYPSMVFHPFDYMSREEDKRECTVSRHIFWGSWI